MNDIMEYWLIQFVPDPIQQERRNVGVMVLGRGFAEFVAIGSEPQVDVEKLRPLAGEFGRDLWVYREWLDWFDSLCRMARDDLSGFRRRLDALEAKGLPFVTRYGGEIEARPDESVKNLARTLYTELVDEPVIQERTPFEKRVEELVVAVGLEYFDGFEEQVEVEFPPQSDFSGGTVFFDFLVDTPPRVALRCLPMHPVRAEFAREVDKTVQDIRVATALRFVPSARCAILTETIPEERSSFQNDLASVARVIDVNAPEAAARLRRILEAL